MNIKKAILSTLLAVFLSAEADARTNEQCRSGVIVDGRQTERADGLAFFFDLVIGQDSGGQCTLHIAIDRPTSDVSTWTAFVTDEQIDTSNETIINRAVSGRFEVTVPGKSGKVYVRLQRLDDGYVWDFPVINLNARR